MISEAVKDKLNVGSEIYSPVLTLLYVIKQALMLKWITKAYEERKKSFVKQKQSWRKNMLMCFRLDKMPDSKKKSSDKEEKKVDDDKLMPVNKTFSREDKRMLRSIYNE
mgnify:CR=1 FL=1